MSDERDEDPDDELPDDELPEVGEGLMDQPGLSQLRLAVAAARQRAPSRRRVLRDGTAGLTVAVGSVPDGMANAALAGVNPVFGLYANIFAPIAGGLLASSALMVINSTSAGAIVAGQSLSGSPAERAESLFLLVVLAGVMQLAFGLLGLGRLMRFVSYSVMTGLVAGLAVVLALSQLPTVTGVEVPRGSTLATTWGVVTRLGEVDPLALGAAMTAVALLMGLSRTNFEKVAALGAIVAPSVVVALLDLDVRLVQDVGDIPTGLPTPFVPSLSSLNLEVISGAFAVAVVVLVQGAGVSQSVSESPSQRGAVSRDFTAQGAANVASGLMRGLPVGGSFKGSILNASAGARGRGSAIFSGLWMLVIVVVFSGLVSRVAMPALGGLLIAVSTRSIQPDNIASVWRAGGNARLAAAATFVATVLLPIQIAILIGVLLAAFLHLGESSSDISIVELVRHEDGSIEERRRPGALRTRQVTVIDVYGYLFYAGATRLQRLLPEPADASQPAVVIRLRGRTQLGATVTDALSQYAAQVREVGGRVYLTGLDEDTRDRLLRDVGFNSDEGVHIYTVTPTLGESTGRAVRDAEAWLAEQRGEG